MKYSQWIILISPKIVTILNGYFSTAFFLRKTNAKTFVIFLSVHAVEVYEKSEIKDITSQNNDRMQKSYSIMSMEWYVITLHSCSASYVFLFFCSF